MTAKSNISNREARTVKFQPEEIEALRAFIQSAKTKTEASFAIGVERTVLYGLMYRDTAAEKTVKQVRKFLKKQAAAQNS